jgi:hypothetical protein
MGSSSIVLSPRSPIGSDRTGLCSRVIPEYTGGTIVAKSAVSYYWPPAKYNTVTITIFRSLFDLLPLFQTQWFALNLQYFFYYESVYFKTCLKIGFNKQDIEIFSSSHVTPYC